MDQCQLQPFVTAIRFSFEDGKMYHSMFNALSPYFASGELVAYLPEEDREVVISDTETEKVVRTLKGVTLKRINEPTYHLASEGRALLLKRSPQGFFIENFETYVIKVNAIEMERARNGIHGLTDHVLCLEKLAKEFEFDLNKVVPTELLQQGTRKTSLNIKDQYLSSDLTIRYHDYGASLSSTDVLVRVRPPEFVDEFLMNIIENIKSEEIAEVQHTREPDDSGVMG